MDLTEYLRVAYNVLMENMANWLCSTYLVRQITFIPLYTAYMTKACHIISSGKNITNRNDKQFCSSSLSCTELIV